MFAGQRVLVTGSGWDIGRADRPAVRKKAGIRSTWLGEPSDITKVAAFLSSNHSRWVRGAIFDVDGGQNKCI